MVCKHEIYSNNTEEMKFSPFFRLNKCSPRVGWESKQKQVILEGNFTTDVYILSFITKVLTNLWHHEYKAVLFIYF